MPELPDLVVVRDFLKIHLKGGQSCPVCGSKISEIKMNQGIYNFCRTCQPPKH